MQTQSTRQDIHSIIFKNAKIFDGLRLEHMSDDSVKNALLSGDNSHDLVECPGKILEFMRRKCASRFVDLCEDTFKGKRGIPRVATIEAFLKFKVEPELLGETGSNTNDEPRYLIDFYDKLILGARDEIVFSMILKHLNAQ